MLLGQNTAIPQINAQAVRYTPYSDLNQLEKQAEANAGFMDNQNGVLVPDDDTVYEESF